MAPTGNVPITVFWSWQSDLPAETTRNFVEDCLKRAAKKAGKAGVGVVAVDRDTKGVGGSPNISETILAKINAADIFVWDASITTTTDRPAPNPNVLFELGFAVAALGWNRIIAVMNTMHGSPDALPFDLRHRRWPIQYALKAREEEASGTDWPERQVVREALVNALAEAISAAVASPPERLTRSDPDLLLAKRRWKSIDSRWMHDWYDFHGDNPQMESMARVKRFSSYVGSANRPEMSFLYPSLQESHGALIEAIEHYLSSVAIEMVPHGSAHFIISVKKRGLMPEREYNAEYKRQLAVVYAGLDLVWQAWRGYVNVLRERYPEILHDDTDEESTLVD